MEHLPNEIFFHLAHSLDLFDLARLKGVNRKFRDLFGYLLESRSKKIPWSIVVDFSRDQNHHLRLHQSWIKIGWFTQESLVHNNLMDIFEYCEICACNYSPKKLVLIQSGTGGPMLFKLLSLRNGGFLSLSKGYCPIIEELSPFTKLQRNTVEVKFVKGEEHQPAKHLIFRPSRQIIQRYYPYVLYQNRKIHWQEILEEIQAVYSA